MTKAYELEPLPPELDALEIDPGEHKPSENELVRMCRAMQLARTFETRLASLCRQGKIIGAVYVGTGQEAIATGVAALLHKDDIFSTVSRSLAAWFYRGVEPKHVVAPGSARTSHRRMGASSACSSPTSRDTVSRRTTTARWRLGFLPAPGSRSRSR